MAINLIVNLFVCEKICFNLNKMDKNDLKKKKKKIIDIYVYKEKYEIKEKSR